MGLLHKGRGWPKAPCDTGRSAFGEVRASAAPFRSEAAHGRPRGKQEAPLWFRLFPHPGGVPDEQGRAKSLFVF